MNPRTIVISLVAHVILGAVVLAVDGKPRQRIATVVQIIEGKAPEPEEPPKPPEPEPEPEKKPEEKPPEPEKKPAPKPRKPAQPRPAARPQAQQPAQDPGGDAGQKPYFSGLVLGNADGPGIAMGVAEDVERRARDEDNPPGKGAGGPARQTPQPALAPPQAARPGRPCADIERPRVLERRATIPYADQARADGAQGRLLLRLHLDAQGNVTRVEVVSSVHPAIDQLAIEAARTWRFEPERRCGRAVPSTYVVARRFELTD